MLDSNDLPAGRPWARAAIPPSPSFSHCSKTSLKVCRLLGRQLARALSPASPVALDSRLRAARPMSRLLLKLKSSLGKGPSERKYSKTKRKRPKKSLNTSLCKAPPVAKERFQLQTLQPLSQVYEATIAYSRSAADDVAVHLQGPPGSTELLRKLRKLRKLQEISFKYD